MRTALMVWFAMAGGSIGAAHGQAEDAAGRVAVPPLPEPVSFVVEPARFAGSAVLAGSEPGVGSMRVVPAEAVPPAADFTEVVEVSTNKRTQNEGSTQLRVPLTSPVKANDVLHVRFWVRATEIRDETGNGRLRYTMGIPDGNGWRQPAAFLMKQAVFGSEWQVSDQVIPGSRIAMPGGEAMLFVNLGNTQPQTVQIGGLAVRNYGPDHDATTLPFDRVTYRGREADAAWRAEAAERIERHRKGDLAVEVVDPAGRPIEGAEVHVKMTRHAYRFGTAVATGQGDPNHQGWQARLLRDQVLALFNNAAPENALKWGPYDQNPQQADRIVDWMVENGLHVHGHVLVWPAWRYVPQRLHTLRDDPEALRKVLRDRVTEVVSRYRGRVDTWDVVNETTWDRELIDAVGQDEMAEWFKLAHAADPEARLFLNENNLLNGQKIDHVLSEVAFLRSNGAPIHGIGLQGHIGPLPPEKSLESLNRLAETGLDLQITEFDTVTPDTELQADVTRDLMTVVFSHPATTGFAMWGFWDGAHWLNDAPIYFRDWRLKPAGREYLRLVFQDWWTDERSTTDGSGVATIRGFLGDYWVDVRHDGRQASVATSIDADGTRLRLTLD